MPQKQNISAMQAMLREPTFAGLANETVREYVDWDQLTQRALPPGLSAAETWELLGMVRQIGAHWFPIPTIDGRYFWYNLNHEGSRCLQFIRRYCRSESPLHRMLQEREGHRFLVRSRVQEAIAACTLDGVLINYEQAGHMLQDAREPHTDEQRLVHNSYQMLRELESLAPEPFTPELVYSIYERITHGVDMKSIARGPRMTNLAGTRNPETMRQAAEERGILQEICDYANLVTGDPHEATAAKGYMILSATAYWQPLPDLNETVGRHLLRLFSVKRDYPVLGYLPTSLMMHNWFEGTLPRGVARFSTLERRPVVGNDIDGTEDILTHLQLTTAAVSELLGYIHQTQEEDERLQEALDCDEHLNYRQRSILARALGRPHAEFRIRSHQMAHRVVYQTARTDLLELVDLGYLQKVMRGKAFVFVPGEGLRALVAD